MVARSWEIFLWVLRLVVDAVSFVERAGCQVKSHLCILAILEFARNPKIFPLQAGFVQSVCDADADQFLILVCWIAVDVSISSLDGPRNGFGGVFTIKIPCSESK